ncbi:MAG: NADH-quinone oxidoreductase subunit J [Candidatus Zixiibacteriota bacterium]
MDTFSLAFFVLAFLIVASAIFVVSSKNIFHSAIFLILALFGVAGIFVLLHAHFLAAAQVLIYVGAIAVLMIFAVMLTSRIADKALRHTNEQVGIGLAVSAGLLAVILYSLYHTPFTESAAPVAEGAGKTLGKLLLTEFVLPFEVVSVLLLAALIGAIIIARRDTKRGESVPPRPIPLPKSAQQAKGDIQS